ncbi:UPF0149 protein [Saliniradius amylolyticus]|uniref:UPF0149 protein n=1 Tax=Saliniradius amylolyticus TaxID=2183582 RepID=A0A2S2E284_9ALTE|nr:UPF0149 family protein [Saliniradius amylolyticus]AWL11127.1 UPF0149 protein [Saliniradius amylolyticus]
MSDFYKLHDQLSATLNSEKMATDAAEVHGILAGMMAGGLDLQSDDWLPQLSDFINQGDPLPADIQRQVRTLFEQTAMQMQSGDFELAICMPDDATPINDRGQALIRWVQGFLLGFGLHQVDMGKMSDDVREALQDFSEISRMDEDMPEGEDAEQALFEVIEYVRVSAMLCFGEHGRRESSADKPSKTLH